MQTNATYQRGGLGLSELSWLRCATGGFNDLTPTTHLKTVIKLWKEFQSLMSDNISYPRAITEFLATDQRFCEG